MILLTADSKHIFLVEFTRLLPLVSKQNTKRLIKESHKDQYQALCYLFHP